MDGAWEIPHPGAKTPTPTAIHAHCLLLYFSASRHVAHLCAPPSRRCLKLPFYNQPLIALRLFSCLLPRQTKGEKTGSNARQDGICNRKCGAAPFRRAHEGSSKKPTNTGCGELHNRACQGIKNYRCQLLFTRTIYCFIWYNLFHHDASNLLFECFP